MSGAETNPAGKIPEVHERKIVLLLCLFAAIHVFVFSATFPFFNIVDEPEHFDLVVRYSQGDMPHSLTPICTEAMPFYTIYGTEEYFWSPEMLPGKQIPPPLWNLPFKTTAGILRSRENAWNAETVDIEASQPPLYYSVAGAWWRLGKALGLDGLTLLYWLRFLNLVFVMVLAWLGWRAAHKIFPENHFIQIAVPALVSFMPQTAFYSISNDILSPVTFGIVFILLVKSWQQGNFSPIMAMTIGLALAATYLTKIGNLPLIAVAGGFLATGILNHWYGEKWRSTAISLGILLPCAGLPMAAWMIWCQLNFGDLTGSMAKIQMLGWTNKPFAEWFHHPLFTPSGLWFFLTRNLSTLWQGEFLWHRKPLAIPAVDAVYLVLTFGALAGTLVTLVRRPSPFTALQRKAVWFGFACLISTFAFFALLSVKYDFQACFYPSRAHPFFTSGRLMLGMLIPFLVLFACGLDCALKKFSLTMKFIALAVLLLFMLGSEITIDWQIFPNVYNWFHM